MLRALLVTHGDLGAELLATACGIVGPAPGVDVLSNRGHSRESLAREVEACLAAWGEGEGVVLTDIHGGSCAQAALTGAIARRSAPVVTGVNLPMLVDFLVNRDAYAAADMAARLIEKGRAGVRIVDAPSAPTGRP